MTDPRDAMPSGSDDHDHDHELHQALQHDVVDHVLGGDSFAPVLLLVLILLFLMTLGIDSITVRLFTAGLAATVVMLTVRRAHVKPRTRRLVDLATIVSVAAAIAGSLIDHSTGDEVTGPRIVASVFFAALLLMAVPTVLRRVLTMRTVTVNALTGALVAYLLLSMFFAATFTVAAEFTQPFFAQLDDPTGSDFTYFSVITITTTGYGDLSPTTGLARSLAMLEAVIGQIFLVTIVARVVAMLGSTREIPAGTGRPLRRLAASMDDETPPGPEEGSDEPGSSEPAR